MVKECFKCYVLSCRMLLYETVTMQIYFITCQTMHGVMFAVECLNVSKIFKGLSDHRWQTNCAL